MASFLSDRGPVLRMEQETIDINSTGPSSDESWKFVDAAGHGHYYEKGYPTLKEITETAYDDGEEWQAHVRWECPTAESTSSPRRFLACSRTALRGCAATSLMMKR